MSLAKKWEEYRIANIPELNDGSVASTCIRKAIERAFYAGAEAVQQSRTDTMGAYWDIQAEIDRFKGQ